ncbi:T9SS C-terminal target domain-containing protein [Pontibacter diazotrophicus]|uniref:T9SS C-terminal target domain-containing protein n=1 Tax=Pontibacter diazotrophicus TaxID=1400979 RepID=A0A3D8L8F7_9BACT|nr:T9SS type A sorting domain-containing protein [Pontibacter diazotrophicus]RDV13711.1 T9SS C-terminal target domain-containing protein [Pontibacter diazotrophicus]
MNTVTTLLLHVVKMAIVFLLAFFPLHQLAAQDAEAEKTKTLRIRIQKEVNGKMQLTDTTVQAADHAQLLQSIKGITVDTASLRRLQSGLSATFKFDTTVAITDFRKAFINAEGLRMDTTAAFHVLNGDKFKIYKLDSEVGSADRRALLERIRSHKMDTIFARSIKGSRILYHRGDSATQFHRFESVKDGNVVKFRIVHPNAIFESVRDSAGNVFRLRPGSETLLGLDPSEIRSIVVHKSSNAISIDSLLSPGETKIQLRVIKDEKTGEKKVYRIDENGKEEEVKAEYLKLGHGISRVVIHMKASVEDINADDKETLKEAGAAVETKKKEVLAVEEINFYPNPNNGRFNLNFSLEDIGTTRVSVMDRNGEEVFVDTVEKLSGEYNRQIDLTPFGRGIYYLQIAQGKKYHTKKILVQ